MSSDQAHLKFLLERHRLNQADQNETLELGAILKEHWDLMDIKTDVQTVAWDDMYARIIKQAAIVEMKPVRHFSWKKLAAASVIMILFSGAGWLIKNRSKIKTKETVTLADIKAPLINRAMITLGDGHNVFLDSAQVGQLAIQNQVKLIKSNNGEIIYQGKNDPAIQKESYNTLTNPRGSQPVVIALSDGTRVWLNAGSAIVYPVAFTGTARNVSITGEAYFEVVHDPAHPFHVRHEQIDIRVLGTHFNINTYTDEPEPTITLLEGSVKVTEEKSKQNRTIIPGQQARINNNEIEVISDINTQEVLAWKNGLFDFESADLRTILRQFARWYDVEIEYRSAIPADKYFVIISRKSSLSAVLKALQTTGIQFTMQDKKLIVGSK